MAYGIVKRGFIVIFKNLLTTAEIIFLASEVIDKKPGLFLEYPWARPLDASFSPDPNFDDPSIPPVPYTDGV